MSTEEILQVLPVELDAMNDPDGKSIPIRLQEIRVVVNLLAAACAIPAKLHSKN